MSSLIFDILDKQKQESNGIASRQDFVLGKSSAFDTEKILEDDNITVYALDFSTQEAIFVQTKSDIDIYEYPFFYQAQYDFAEKIIVTSFEAIIELKLQSTEASYFIFLHSVGRCGSTLLYKLLSCSTSIFSISEPDILAQLVAIRTQDKQNDQYISSLLKFFLPLTCKKDIRNSKEKPILIKTRSFSIEIADLLSETFPQSKSFFLYRNAYKVVNSSVRAFGEALERKKSIILENIDLYKNFFHLLSQLKIYITNSSHFTSAFFSMAWLSAINLYLKFSDTQILLFAVRYEELLEETETMVNKICHKLSINEISAEDISDIMQQDSQLDSNLSQRKLASKKSSSDITTDKLHKNIDRIIEAYDSAITVDPVLPKTLDIKS